MSSGGRLAELLLNICIRDTAAFLDGHAIETLGRYTEDCTTAEERRRLLLGYYGFYNPGLAQKQNHRLCEAVSAVHNLALMNRSGGSDVDLRSAVRKFQAGVAILIEELGADGEPIADAPEALDAILASQPR